MREVDGRRAFVLVGHPVEHSLSPAIHRAAFRALGVEATYALQDVEPAGLEEAVRSAAPAGGGNVTLPHKERIVRLLDEASATVRATGACNCFWWREGRLAGDNTDVGAFSEVAAELCGDGWPARTVLLLGAGGAARAVLHACLSAGVGRIDLLDRTPDRARVAAGSVLAEAGADASRVRVLESVGGQAVSIGAGGRSAALALPGETPVSEYGLVVNATSLGLRPDHPEPLALESAGGTAVLDLAYGPEETPWVRHARELGLRAADGTGMLVAQAAASLERWLGVAAPREVMEAAARRAKARVPR